MRVVSPSVEILSDIRGEDIVKHIEMCGRVCYKSEDKITDDSATGFVQGVIKRGHESVVEHYSVTVKFVVDRGVSHEIVRHRIASYSQESTRYCNYSKEGFGSEITVIKPCFLEVGTLNYNIWYDAMQNAEKAYFAMLDGGCTAQEARSVLPNSLKTEIVVTMNMREWRHFFKLRTESAAHPQMREVAIPLCREFQNKIPVLFDDIILS